MTSEPFAVHLSNDA